MNILGLSGLAGAGKDTVADLLKNHGFVKVSLSDPLKRICQNVFAFSNEQLWGPSEKRNECDRRYPRWTQDDLDRAALRASSLTGPSLVAAPVGPAFLTPRYALQQLGTDWGRHCYPNVWIDHAIRTAKTLLLDPFSGYRAAQGLVMSRATEPARGVVIPDVRFENELEAIARAGGRTWRVVRPGAGLGGTAGAHVSENELSDHDVRYAATLLNVGSLEALGELVDSLMRVA